MKKIIVPVDFSKYSEFALETAAFLAKKNDAEIIAVHMLELSDAVISQSQNYINEQMVFYLKLAEQKFSNFLDREILNGIKVTPVIEHFKIFRDLDKLAKESEADLIVMGSKGASGLHEILLGSNTEKVIRFSETPVLIVKERAITEAFDKVIFGCDFSENTIPAYLKIKEFFTKFNLKLELVYVNTPNGKFLSTDNVDKKIINFFTKANEPISQINEVKRVSEYSVEKGLFYYAEKNSIDLIALATHGRKGLAHFFEGSISEDIANHSKIPIISFKIDK